MYSFSFAQGNGGSFWNQGCKSTPWGPVVSGFSGTAYSTALPAGPCSGVSQTRTCSKRVMSGSFTSLTCTNGCAAGTTSNCDHSAVASGGSSGACASGYAGDCEYSCTNGARSLVSNNCAPPATYTYNGQYASITNASTFSWSAAVGTASATRYVLVAILRRGSATLTGCTIAGSAATVLVDAGTHAIAFCGRTVASGTTASIGITFSASVSDAAIASYSLYSLQSTTPVAVTSANVYPATATIQTMAGGVLVAAHSLQRSASGTFTTTWTGVTENFDVNVEDASGASSNFSAGSLSVVTSEAARSITATPSAYTSTSISVVSFR